MASFREPMRREEVDETLARLGAESDRIAAALLDLDSNPGMTFLRGNSRLAGDTARGWETAQADLATLWSRFDTYRSALDRARALRARSGRLSAERLAELTEVLRGKTVELSREQVPLAERSLTGPTEVSRWTSLADLVEQMSAAYQRVADVVAAVDQAWSALASALTPVEDTWRGIEALAASLEVGPNGPVAEAFQRCGAELADIREVAFCDPLGCHGGPATARLSRLDGELAALRARLDSLATLRAGFDARAEALRERFGEVEDVRARTASVWEQVRVKIAAPGPTPETGPVTALRERLDDLARLRASADWQRLADEMSTLERQADEALESAGGVLRETTELLDRRTELRGRLDAYRAMAGRQGRIEDAELGARYEEARRLLWTAPCDLRAATRAVASYQQAVRGGTPAPGTQAPSGVGPGGSQMTDSGLRRRGFTGPPHGGTS